MKLQKQTSFGGKDDPDPGNCWSTCVAMLVGMDTKDVPNFCGIYREGEARWLEEANRWLAKRGVLIMVFTSDPTTWGESYRDTVCIASGPAVRGHDHAVLWQGGKLLHDPHPSNDGLVEAREFEVMVVVDPDLFAAHLRSIQQQERAAIGAVMFTPDDDKLGRMGRFTSLIPPPGDEVARELIAALRLERQLRQRATRYEFGLLILESRSQDEDSWAICRAGGEVLAKWAETRTPTWEYEPPPSSRTPEFLARVRWTFEDAIRVIARMLPEESTFRSVA